MRKDPKPYQCWKCSTKFRTYGEFLHHVRTFHQGKPVKRIPFEPEDLTIKKKRL